MRKSKLYEPRCPDVGCGAGRSYLSELLASTMPAEVLAKKRPDQKVYHCRYCKLVWVQSAEALPGFDPRLQGYYNDVDLGAAKFTALNGPRKIHPQNTPEYWVGKSVTVQKRNPGSGRRNTNRSGGRRSN